MGGPAAVAEATGSAAYCRFSGNQVNDMTKPIFRMNVHQSCFSCCFDPFFVEMFNATGAWGIGESKAWFMLFARPVID